VCVLDSACWEKFYFVAISWAASNAFDVKLLALVNAPRLCGICRQFYRNMHWVLLRVCEGIAVRDLVGAIVLIKKRKNISNNAMHEMSSNRMRNLHEIIIMKRARRWNRRGIEALAAAKWHRNRRHRGTLLRAEQSKWLGMIRRHQLI
jgi:hypothetical protein